jgi:hypothetical protein
MTNTNLKIYLKIYLKKIATNWQLLCIFVPNNFFNIAILYRSKLISANCLKKYGIKIILINKILKK